MNIARARTFRLKELTDSQLRFPALSTHVFYPSLKNIRSHFAFKKYDNLVDPKYAYPSIYASHSSFMLLFLYEKRKQRKYLSKFEMKSSIKIPSFS